MAPQAGPARLFLSDSQVSFELPSGWDFSISLTSGMKLQPESADAPWSIQLRSSVVAEPAQLHANLPVEQLRRLAVADLEKQAEGGRILSESVPPIAGGRILELNWNPPGASSATQVCSAYLYSGNHLISAIFRPTAAEPPQDFSGFNTWLGTLQFLSRRDHGALSPPVRGGTWIHEAGGLRLNIPDTWIIGVADDRMVAATTVVGSQRTDLTATVEECPTPCPATVPLAEADLAAMRQTATRHGGKILQEEPGAFHGLPAFLLTYEASDQGRTVRGQDVWVFSPRGHWLISFVGDPALFSRLSPAVEDILHQMQFL